MPRDGADSLPPAEPVQIPTDPREIQGDLVHVEFVKFITLNTEGKETDRRTEPGYLVYNAHHQEFVWRSFRDSDSYTLTFDVLHHIDAHHPRLMRYIRATNGFY
ncbi:MAG: hypothetical protein K6T30_09485, partial [Alicyclobacillus sp.]|nr:hypothetical protein [Alicyclobacillus sp.]